MHNVVISKIECWDSGHGSKEAKGDRWKGMIKHNLNYLEYISTRDGVDLSKLDETKSSRLEESSQNGLFGHYMVGSVKEVQQEIKKLGERKQPIFRGVLSLSEEDAIELGYLKKNKWKSLMDEKMADIAKEFGIDAPNLRWVAAYHYEKGHPHIHYMFWDSSEKIQRDFVFKKQQNKCRTIFSKCIFKEELNRMVMEKTLRNALILGENAKTENGKGKHINGQVDDILEKVKIAPLDYHIIEHISNKDIKEIAGMMSEACFQLPKNGRFAYGFLQADVKDKIDKIVDRILEIPAVKKEYEEYRYYLERQYKTHSLGKKAFEEAVKKEFKTEFYNPLANRIINVCKEAIKNHKSAVWQEKQDEKNDYEMERHKKQMQKQMLSDTYKLIRSAAESFMKAKSRHERENKRTDVAKNQRIAEAKRQGKIHYQEER